ncbi:subtilisin-like protease sdd1 [Phtheirospermum japonicum]|uniref:Subtilisin-like protease sdd1 n=1 Tax=Phtheirospermum japonicum TaxID=374723 RepID=A0A830DB79_9LAMI|nr:subtilisin-like protease sdd1 [Phtheirospermum japonicum]
MAPRAHLAIYKVCTKSGCSSINMLAGLDAAIEDGKGIFVSCSGGNHGPFKKSIRSEAPWGNTSLFDVEGKVVLCDGSKDISHVDQGWEVNEAGGAAAILANREQFGFTVDANPHFLPATEVSTVIGDPLAPTVTSFSSRGPSVQTPGLLKPDIIGPGMNILAASPFHFDDTDTKLTFYIDSGTSMSTPHLAGVAALLKSAHPNWSPAAIKSAIMTTAGLLNAGKTAILDEKHTPADGYTDEQVGKIVRKPVNCTLGISQGQLNYPTFSVSLGPSQTFTRTVTNVGEPVSYYFVRIVAPKGVRINVKPRQLWFWRVGQKATYSVTFRRCGNMTTNDTYSQGYLQWVSRKHKVRSVISVMLTGGGGA